MAQPRTAATAPAGALRQPALAAQPPQEPKPALTPEHAWSALRQWIEQPQRSWLEGLGLRPREFDHPVLDRDALELGERERSALLRQQLDPLPPALPDWPQLERGTGLLPPLAAGELEVQQLSARVGQAGQVRGSGHLGLVTSVPQSPRQLKLSLLKVPITAPNCSRCLR